VDPYTVWDMPPSYNTVDNLQINASAADNSFTRLIPSLSGQTISSLDNLVASGGGVGNFNAAPGTVMVDAPGGQGPVTGIGMTGHTASGPGGGIPPQGPPAFGMSPMGTPVKPEYADWGAPGGGPGGSAPGSGNKNLMGSGVGYIERGDVSGVRRNIVTNQNAMWPKNWAEE